MPDLDRETRVLRAVVSLADSLLDDFDVVELLTDLTERCAELLNVDSAGLLLADSRGHLQLIAATSEEARDLELFQLQSSEGPCLDSFTSAQSVSVADLRADRARWSQFSTAAVDAGIFSAHAVPMRAAGHAFGALGLFGTQVGELNAADQLLAQTLAHVASVVILQENFSTPDSLDVRLRAILDDRVVIEQTEGLLREHLGVSVEDAFVILRTYAQAHHEHLTVVARRLMFEPQARPAIVAAMRRAAPGLP